MAIQCFERKKALGIGIEDFMVAKHEFDDESKAIVSFSVNQICQFKDRIFEIIRFDTAHGFCHIHRFYESLKPKQENLYTPIGPESFRSCRQDIEKNWQDYKKRYFKRWQPK